MPGETFSKIIDAINRNFDLSQCAEITFEANPGTMNATRLAEFRAAGATRISIGVQSLHDAELEFLGRRHTAHDARQLIDAALASGMRLNADFIYGLPGQDAHAVEQMCHEINTIGLRHCSMYELTIEPGTPFGKMHLSMPDNDEMAQMYMAIADTLTLPRYEVSNYAAPGFECRHNQNVWDGDAYIGIGRGAAGRVLIDGEWYEQTGAHARFEKMSGRDRAIEKIITGLRTARGVRLSPDVSAEINWQWARANTGLIEWDENRMHATPAGLLTLDNLLLQLTSLRK